MDFKSKMSHISEEMTRLQSDYDLLLEDTKKKQDGMKKMNEEMQEIGRKN